jgi:CRP-like cAMP-binding protein
MTTPATGNQTATDRYTEFLRQMSLFQGLSDAQLASMVAICRPVDVQAGTAVLREGDSGDNMFILVEGRVEITRTLALKLATGSVGEVEKSFTRLEAKDHVLFGEMALLEQNQRAATVAAATDCHLLEIRQHDFEEVCTADAQLGYTILRNMARQLSARLRRSDQDVLKLTTALSLALDR